MPHQPHPSRSERRPPHPHDADDIVGRAERLAAERRQLFTAMRRRVLEALAGASRPLGAYEIAERVGEGTSRRVAPVQVYRALEFLTELSVVHRIATRNAYLACDHHHAPGETAVFLVCTSCGTVAEAASPVIEQGLQGTAAASGFRPTHPVVEVEGECAACQAEPLRAGP